MNLLFYIRPKYSARIIQGEDYVVDQDAPFWVEQSSPAMWQAEVDDSVWIFTRRPSDGAYVLDRDMVVGALPYESPDNEFGEIRIDGDVERTRFFDIQTQPSFEEAIRSLEISTEAHELYHAFQGHAAVRVISMDDHAKLVRWSDRLEVVHPPQEGAVAGRSVRSWSRPEGIPGLLGRKRVDWSCFEDGSHIPQAFAPLFEDANGRHLAIGESEAVTLLVGDDTYRVLLVNSDRSRSGVASDTLQIRWDTNDEFKTLLTTIFRASLDYISRERDSRAGPNRRPNVVVPDDIAEYIDFIRTDKPYVYRLEFISAGSASVAIGGEAGTEAEGTGVTAGQGRPPRSSTTPVPALMNVAFKLTWVYGEGEPWATPCTNEGRDINIRLQSKVWCRQEQCPCRGLYDRGAANPASDAPRPCWDFGVFQDWYYGAGVFHSGDRSGQSQYMKKTGIGKWAIITSRRSDMSEAERRIIGAFRIDRVSPGGDLGVHELWSDSENTRLRVPPGLIDSAPRYWDFHTEPQGAKWATLLFRYIPDHEAEAMRAAIAATCDGINPAVWDDIEAKRLEDEYFEGQRSTRLVSYYERNPNLRSAAIEKHGTSCQVCGLDFSRRYGELGAGFIEVHHLKPVADYDGKDSVDPETEMAVACPNCHRMLHRRKDGPLTIEELREILLQQGDV